jgi:hypothetical protein
MEIGGGGQLLVWPNPSSRGPVKMRHGYERQGRGDIFDCSRITQHLLEDFPCGTLNKDCFQPQNNVEEGFHEDASHCLWKEV